VKLVDLSGDTKGERGEIWVRGANVSAGYFDGVDADGNMKVLSIQDRDGWFRTGDVGVWDEATGGLKIVDRIKNIFKLQQGEFVSVEKIEGVVTGNVAGVEQCYCYGDPTRRFVVGVVTLDEKWRGEMEARLGKGESVAGVVQENITKASRKAGLQGFECIKKITIAEELFGTGNGLATPTFKLVRKKLKERFGQDIERMYRELDEFENSKL
jgi:long-chain acyl-CoA synthetase